MSDLVKRGGEALFEMRYRDPLGLFDGRRVLSEPQARQVFLRAAGFLLAEMLADRNEYVIQASYDRERQEWGPLARGMNHSAIFETRLRAFAAENGLTINEPEAKR